MAITFKITSFVEYVWLRPTNATPNTWHRGIVEDLLSGHKSWATEMQLDSYQLTKQEVLGTFLIVCRRGDSKFVVAGTTTTTTKEA